MPQSLPARPNLQQLRNQAKDLQKAVMASDMDAIARVVSVYKSAGNRPSEFKLAEALLVVAREYGFPSWMKLKAHVNAMRHQPEILSEALEEESAAKAIFHSMFSAIREASSLRAKIQHSTTYAGRTFETDSSTVWLKKPFLARIDSKRNTGRNESLICDGIQTGVLWPQGRPTSVPGELQDTSLLKRQYQRFQSSLGLADPNVNTSSKQASILDLGIFHGISANRFETNIEAYQLEETATLDGGLCRCVYVTYSNRGIYSLRIWVSYSDLLPRRIVYESDVHIVAENSSSMTSEEIWSDVEINGSIPDERFSWQPPVDGIEWTPPNPDSVIIQSGEHAPPFEFQGAKGERCVLEELAGRTVVLSTNWRLQDRRQRELLCDLQRLLEIFEPDGMSVVAISMFGQSPSAMIDFLDHERITFPICCNAAHTFSILHNYRIVGEPAFVIIDPQGLVVESWTQDYDRLEPAIRRLLNGASVSSRP